MGLFKKIFKPVSKVLDKIIPNEIKPALPFAAAFAPFIAPGIMGTTVMQRALMGGGLNIFGQLAQEGNEGDINLLSAGLGALSGAMSAPGSTTADFSAAGPMEAPALIKTPSGAEFFQGISDSAQGTGVLASGQRFLGDTLVKGSNIMGEGIKQGLFTKAGAKAALLPAATATGDLMAAEAKRAQDEADRLAEEEAAAAGEDDAVRAFAIRRAMEAQGATEEEILDAIAAAGYKAGGLISLRKGGRVGFSEGGSDFGGITEAVEKIEKKPKTFLVDKLKVTMKPGQSEMRAIIEAMYNDVDGVMPDDRKKEFYELYAPQMYRNGEMEKSEFEFIQTEILGKEMKAAGGRIGFRDGSSTGNFGMDRYGSEMISEGKMLNKDITDFLNKYEDIVKEGKADERLFDLLKEYKTLEDKAEKVEDKFSNYKLQDAAEGIMSVDDLKYYNKKIEDLDKELTDKDERLSDIDKEFATKGIDASEITKTPDFQEWLKLYMSERGSSRMKSLDHPNADIYLSILGINLGGRDKSFYETVPKAKDGGLMNLGGKEMDLRGGGFVPIGKKERADDVPARLSKNEFVMTADAVRAAGGGSVNKGAKRMYNLMNTLEARA